MDILAIILLCGLRHVCAAATARQLLTTFFSLLHRATVRHAFLCTIPRCVGSPQLCMIPLVGSGHFSFIDNNVNSRKNAKFLLKD